MSLPPPSPAAREPVPPRPDALHPPAPSQGPPVPDGALPGRTKATWGIGEAVGVYVLALLVGAVAISPVLLLMDEDDFARIFANAAGSLVNVGILVLWLRARHSTWRSVVRFPGRSEWWPEIRASVGFGLLVYPVLVFGVGALLRLLLSAISGEPVQAPEQVSSDPSLATAVGTALYAIVIAPLHEEFFFRGVLFRGARDHYGLVVGMFLSAIAFGLIHYLSGPWQNTALLMGVMVFVGVAFAWLYERRGTIVAPIVAHMVFNVVALTLIWTIE